MPAATKNPLGKLIGAGLRVAHPSSLRVLIQDWLGQPDQTEDSRGVHLDGAIAWMCHAQDVCGEACPPGIRLCTAGSRLIPKRLATSFRPCKNYGHLTGNESSFDRARRMADWETEIQLPSGAVMGGVYRGPGHEAHPVVFNTGQVVYSAGAAPTAKRAIARYLSAAKRAGDWLLSVQSEDGAWRLTGPEVQTLVHAYDEFAHGLELARN